MIKGVNAGNGLQVSNSYGSWPQFYNTVQSTGNSLIGQVRYLGSSQNFEVFDGNSWIMMAASYPTVELSGEVLSILNWAKAKMAEELRLKQLAQRHPSLQDALDQLQHAQEQVRIVEALVTT